MGYRSYTADEYRRAGINAGPYALEGNPDPAKRNYRTERRTLILGVAMHITAGMTDYTSPDSSAEGTTKYGMNTERDASWHVCIDSDGIIPSIRDSYVAWHAGVADIPNVNDATLGIEQGTGQVDWRKAPDWWVKLTIRNVAVWLAPRVRKYGIPLVVCRDRNDMDRAIRAGRKFGFVAHATVAPHNRRDPGMVGNPPTWIDTYPWALLFQYIREELARLDGDTTPTTPPAPTGGLTMADIDDIMTRLRSIEAKIDEVPNETKTAIVWYHTEGQPSLYGAAVDAAAKSTQLVASLDLATFADAVADQVEARLASLPGGTAATKEVVAEAVRDVLGSLNDPVTPPLEG